MSTMPVTDGNNGIDSHHIQHTLPTLPYPTVTHYDECFYYQPHLDFNLNPPQSRKNVNNNNIPLIGSSNVGILPFISSLAVQYPHLLPHISPTQPPPQNNLHSQLDSSQTLLPLPPLHSIDLTILASLVPTLPLCVIEERNTCGIIQFNKVFRACSVVYSSYKDIYRYSSLLHPPPLLCDSLYPHSPSPPPSPPPPPLPSSSSSSSSSPLSTTTDQAMPNLTMYSPLNQYQARDFVIFLPHQIPPRYYSKTYPNSLQATFDITHLQFFLPHSTPTSQSLLLPPTPLVPPSLPQSSPLLFSLSTPSSQIISPTQPPILPLVSETLAALTESSSNTTTPTLSSSHTNTPRVHNSTPDPTLLPATPPLCSSQPTTTGDTTLPSFQPTHSHDSCTCPDHHEPQSYQFDSESQAILLHIDGIGRVKITPKERHAHHPNLPSSPDSLFSQISQHIHASAKSNPSSAKPFKLAVFTLDQPSLASNSAKTTATLPLLSSETTSAIPLSPPLAAAAATTTTTTTTTKTTVTSVDYHQPPAKHKATFQLTSDNVQHLDIDDDDDENNARFDNADNVTIAKATRRHLHNTNTSSNLTQSLIEKDHGYSHDEPHSRTSRPTFKACHISFLNNKNSKSFHTNPSTLYNFKTCHLKNLRQHISSSLTSHINNSSKSSSTLPITTMVDTSDYSETETETEVIVSTISLHPEATIPLQVVSNSYPATIFPFHNNSDIDNHNKGTHDKNYNTLPPSSLDDLRHRTNSTIKAIKERLCVPIQNNPINTSKMDESPLFSPLLAQSDQLFSSSPLLLSHSSSSSSSSLSVSSHPPTPNQAPQSTIILNIYNSASALSSSSSSSSSSPPSTKSPFSSNNKINPPSSNRSNLSFSTQKTSTMISTQHTFSHSTTSLSSSPQKTVSHANTKKTNNNTNSSTSSTNTNNITANTRTTSSTESKKIDHMAKPAKSVTSSTKFTDLDSNAQQKDTPSSTFSQQHLTSKSRPHAQISKFMRFVHKFPLLSHNIAQSNTSLSRSSYTQHYARNAKSIRTKIPLKLVNKKRVRRLISPSWTKQTRK